MSPAHGCVSDSVCDFGHCNQSFVATSFLGLTSWMNVRWYRVHKCVESSSDCDSNSDSNHHNSDSDSDSNHHDSNSDSDSTKTNYKMIPIPIPTPESESESSFDCDSGVGRNRPRSVPDITGIEFRNKVPPNPSYSTDYTSPSLCEYTGLDLTSFTLKWGLLYWLMALLAYYQSDKIIQISLKTINLISKKKLY